MDKIIGIEKEEKEKQKKFSFYLGGLVIFLLSCFIYYLIKGILDEKELSLLYQFLTSLAFSLIFCLLPDLVFSLPLLFKKELSFSKRIQEYLQLILSSHAYLYGILLFLILPLGLKWYEIAIPAVSGILLSRFMKLIFSQRFINPALAARIMAEIFFKKSFLNATGVISFDLASFVDSEGINLWNLFVGDRLGILGEPFILSLAVIGIFFVSLKILSCQESLAFLLSMYLSFVLAFAGLNPSFTVFQSSLVYLFSGGIVFASVFFLSNPLIHSFSKETRMVSLLLSVLITVCIRFYAKTEGVYLGLVLGFIVASFYESFLNKAKKRKLVFALTSLLLLLTILAVSLTYRFVSPL